MTTQLNCTETPCMELSGLDVIRPKCLGCGKKKNERYYVVGGIPGICQDCGEKIKQRATIDFQI